jgi:ABC-type spermidine/putrescine transport system permease subunit I
MQFFYRSAVTRLPSGYGLLALPLLVAMVVLFIWPIAEIFWTSIYRDGFTLEHYRRALTDDLYLRVLWTTVRISVLTTAVCLLIGYPFAYAMARASSGVQAFLLGVVTLSFLISLLVKNYAWTLLLQDRGLINVWLMDAGLISRPLPLMYNAFGVILAMTHTLLPFMILPVYSVLVRLDKRLESASSSLGAGRLRTFVSVVLPLSMPGIGAGSFLVFVSSLGFFVTPALLGSRREMMLSNLIDNQIRTALNWPFGATLAMVLLVVAAAIYIAYVRIFGSDKPWEQT